MFGEVEFSIRIRKKSRSVTASLIRFGIYIRVLQQKHTMQRKIGWQLSICCGMEGNHKTLIELDSNAGLQSNIQYVFYLTKTRCPSSLNTSKLIKSRKLPV
jgi:hypothetical protein